MILGTFNDTSLKEYDFENIHDFLGKSVPLHISKTNIQKQVCIFVYVLMCVYIHTDMHTYIYQYAHMKHILCISMFMHKLVRDAN